MKLEEGVYTIPAECTVYYCGRKVYVKKMKKCSEGKRKHCCDCIHQRFGKKTTQNQRYDSAYCEVKPKIINGKAGYFYNAISSNPACDQFEQKSYETKEN